MNIAIRIPRMTREAFFDWAEAQDLGYEFDGFQPVAMTAGMVNHNQMAGNLTTALRARLKGGPCRPLGPHAGIATIGDAVRYPDALVTCTKVDGTARLVPGVIVVFEVLSPTSGRIDKLLEYRAVPSIRRYVILEYTTAALQVFTRNHADTDWTATALTADETLELPEIGISLPVTEFYEDVDLAAQPAET